jgi:hypothetical protein
MDLVSKEIMALLTYLLPGFIAAWVYYGLTSFPRPSQFERIVQALIFVVFVQFFTTIFKWLFVLFDRHISHLGQWTPDIALNVSIIFALLIGLFFARYANNDRIHALLRKGNFTKETSHPSEWFGVFAQKQTYVVLHLKDGRRMYGWPEEWPSQPSGGHFSISAAEWLDEENRISLEGVENILIPATEVVFVEFMALENNTNMIKQEINNGT